MLDDQNVHLRPTTCAESRAGEIARRTVEDLRLYIDHVIGTFGCGRLMFGSDWPVSTLAVEYGRWLEIVQEAAAGASDTEKHQLFWGTAEGFYHLQ